jgi:hypothetical protein
MNAVTARSRSRGSPIDVEMVRSLMPGSASGWATEVALVGSSLCHATPPVEELDRALGIAADVPAAVVDETVVERAQQ